MGKKMTGDGPPKRKRARIESSSESSEDTESTESTEGSVSTPDTNCEGPVSFDSPSQNPIHQVIHEASSSCVSNHCPRFTAVVEQAVVDDPDRESEDGAIGLEDLDAIQTELETLLVTVVRRQRVIDSQLTSLASTHDEKKTKDRKSAPSSKSSDGGSKKSKSEEKSQRIKDNASSSSSSTSSSFKGHSKAKNKNVSQAKPVESYETAAEPVPFLRNDVPDRFWRLVNSYCDIPTPDHIKALEEIVDSYQNLEDSEFFKVPNLGKHYSLRWGETDEPLLRSSTRKSSSKKGLSPSNAAGTSSLKTSKSKKPSKDKDDPDRCTFGALTQRLVSCLMEEKGATFPDFGEDDINIKGENGTNGGNGLFKKFAYGNAAQLEKRIRKELESQGLVDLDDILSSPESVDDKDILKELMKCQSELKNISTENKEELKRLIERARKQVKLREMEEQLQAIDTEVMEAYRRLLLAKVKKRILTKKEKDAAWKALKDRQSLLSKINDLEAACASSSTAI